VQRNQHLPGWCVLLLHRHVREPHELPEAERIAFFEDMVRVGRALEQVYAAIKINYSILGNIVPHVHAHTAARTMREDRSMPLFNFDHRHIPARHTISTRLRLSADQPNHDWIAQYRAMAG